MNWTDKDYYIPDEFQEKILDIFSNIPLHDLSKEKWMVVREELFATKFTNVGKEYICSYIKSEPPLEIEIIVNCWHSSLCINVVANGDLTFLKNNHIQSRDFLDEGRKITMYFREAFYYLLDTYYPELKKGFDQGYYKFSIDDQENIFARLLG